MKIKWMGVVLAFLLSTSMTYAEDVESYNDENPYNWETANPDDYGFEDTDIEAVTNGLDRLRSVLVVRNGKIILENYYGEGNQNTAYNIHSVSKSIISTLVGMAFDQGLIESLDNKVLDYFPEYISDELDDRKWDITLKHLLTMTSGIDFDEGDSNQWTEYMNEENHVKYIIELPLRFNPGESHYYNSMQTHLLSAIISKVSHTSTYNFALDNLFEPLGVTIDHWPQDPQGIHRGGHDFYITPRDMARFGYLFLKDGKIGDQQIVTLDWIKKAIIDQTVGDVEYGYLWWITQFNGFNNQIVDTYRASGLGGQNICIAPQLNTVIVVTSTVPGFLPYPNQGGDMHEIMDHIISKLNPSIEISTGELNASTSDSAIFLDEDARSNDEQINVRTYLVLAFAVVIMALKIKKRKTIYIFK